MQLDKWDVTVIISVNAQFHQPHRLKDAITNRKALLEISGSLPIIEDDVFGSLAFDAPIASLKELDNQDRVIYVNSLSKTLDSRLSRESAGYYPVVTSL